MIIEVSALRVPSPRDATDSSADEVSAETSPALESDAPWGEGTRSAETSRIIVFVLVGGCPKVSRRARWPPTSWTSTAKHYAHRGFGHLAKGIPSETSRIAAFGPTDEGAVANQLPKEKKEEAQTS